jgi:hypothetical protein
VARRPRASADLACPRASEPAQAPGPRRGPPDPPDRSRHGRLSVAGRRGPRRRRPSRGRLRHP